MFRTGRLLCSAALRLQQRTAPGWLGRGLRALHTRLRSPRQLPQVQWGSRGWRRRGPQHEAAPRRLWGTLAAGAVFLWEKEKIQDEEIRRCAAERIILIVD